MDCISQTTDHIVLPFSCWLWVLGENNITVANTEKTEVGVSAGTLSQG